MATLTHRGFRELVASYGGCDIAFTEMANAASVVSRSRFEEYYIDPEPCREKTVIQFVGGKAEDLFAAISLVHERYASRSPGGLFGIDINMGCSAPQITRIQGGAAWLSRPAQAVALIGEARTLCPDTRLSVKLRLGARDDPEALVSLCKNFEAEGVDFLTIHPRLQGDGLGRPPRWERVVLLKRELSIPVMGNGDVDSFASWKKRKQQAACDGIMIGRAAARMPWIFALLRARQRDPTASMEIDLMDCAERFVELLGRHQPDDFQETRSKRFFFHFCQNLVWGHYPKFKTQNVSRPDEALAILRGYFDECPEERTWRPGPAF
jgi:tRNA-dihydrouridine synthase B